MTDRTQAPDGWRVARLGPVPESWELRRIDGLVERVDDIRGEIEPEPTVLSCSKDHGLVPQMELFRRRLASTDTRRYKLVHPGDFVYDPNLLWSGAIARSHEQAIGIVSPVYEIFRVVRDCSQDFLFAWLMSPSRLPNYRAISMGTNVRRRRADFDDFSKLPILLPPLAEQRAIAAVLDSIDEAIERTEEAIAATERLRDALLHELLTRGVPGCHNEWKEAPGVGTIPAGWDVVRLGDVAEVRNGTTPSRAEANYWQDGDVPFIKTGQVNDTLIEVPDEFITSQAVASAGAVVVPMGSVLIAMIGQGKTRGMTAQLRIDAAINQNFAAVFGADGDFSLDFFFTWARHNYSHIRALGQGSNQDALNCALIEGMRVPNPTLAEQQYIAAMTNSMDDAIEQARQERNGLQMLKASAADALLTGRVRVGRCPWK